MALATDEHRKQSPPFTGRRKRRLSRWTGVVGVALATCVACCTFASTTARAETFPTYGAAMDGPAGWKSLIRDDGKRVARWALLDATGKPSHLLMVDAGKPADPTIDSAAPALAKRFNGRVSDKPSDVGGERAVRVLADHAGRGMQPVEMLVTSHGGVQYFIFGGLARPGSCHEAVEQVRKSWKWVERKPPASCLDDRSRLQIADLGIRVRLPKCAAIVPGMKDHASLHVALRDPAEAEDEALFMTQIAPAQPEVPFAQVTENFRQGWNAKGLTEAALVWTTNDAAGRTVVSNVLTIKERGPNGKEGRVVWALRQLDESIVLINFTLATDDEEELARYAKFAAEFVRDVEKVPQGK